MAAPVVYRSPSEKPTKLKLCNNLIKKPVSSRFRLRIACSHCEKYLPANRIGNAAKEDARKNCEGNQRADSRPHAGREEEEEEVRKIRRRNRISSLSPFSSGAGLKETQPHRVMYSKSPYASFLISLIRKKKCT